VAVIDREMLTAGAALFLASAIASPMLTAETTGITLPDGFTATVFHDGVGSRARHLAVRDNGDVFISRKGELVALRDNNADSKADIVETRELPITTGLEIHNPFLYFSDNVSVSRVMLDAGLMPTGEVETIVKGFPQQGAHAAKSIALNDRGELYVNVGAPSNACQEKRRSPGSPGQFPCPHLERQAAIWRFSASRLEQDQLDGERYLTGIRNVMALDWNDKEQTLYFAMHGRDQLSNLWPDYYGEQESAEMPAEEFHRARQGANYGWPYTYVDPASGKHMVGPEYGGDGKTESEVGKYQRPLWMFPAHWAPNDLVFYTGSAFPGHYHGGVFIAWHGSWNRAPLPQEGYRVTFQPFADGTVTGDPEDFMMGFKGSDELKRPSAASHRPGGLGVGPDGALYVTESIKGRVWKVTYTN
jgi:glucose/arabinose dehydrogenase